MMKDMRPEPRSDHKEPNWREEVDDKDWRFFIMPDIKKMWHWFSDEQKLDIAKNAQMLADTKKR